MFLVCLVGSIFKRAFTSLRFHQERLNGRDFGGEEVQDEEPAVSNDTNADPPLEPQCVAEKRRRFEAAQLLLADAEAAKNEAVDLEIVPSATTASQVARSRLSLRECEDVLEERRLRALLASVDLLLERTAVALEADLKRANVADWDVSGRQLKLFVVEFSLLDKQALWYLKYVPEDAEACVASGCADFTYVLAAEELSVLKESCIEFASRLGLEESVAGDARGLEGLETQVKGLLAQTSRTLRRAGAGGMFYVDGAKLLWQDLQYACTLFSRAALSNYTLRAREVRALQRTAKDLATLIPFLIILIIPLSPMGHVLVFSFIQKYFPEFFPSPFTERRQNVMKIYQEILPRVNEAKDRVT